MATQRGNLWTTANLDELAMVEGALVGVATTIESDRFLEPIVQGAHTIMANQFDEHMDMLREARPMAFHHVYEWWSSPKPWEEARLWKHSLKGQGVNRTATWTWKASKSFVPTLKQRKEAGDPWVAGISDEDIAKVTGGPYVFNWKAPIMEYNMPVKIRPRRVENLFVPAPDTEKGFVFRKWTELRNPGGSETTGAFTAAWTFWWRNQANSVIESSFEKSLKNSIENNTAKVLKKGRNKRDVKISTIQSNKQAFEIGKRWAEKAIMDTAREMEDGR